MKCTSYRKLLACLCVVSALGLSYVCGAAAMFFDLPTSDFLEKAFTGAHAWYEQRRELSETPPGAEDLPEPERIVDQPGKTFDGFTLYTMYPGSQAVLINMRGDVVHKWTAPFSQVWPRPKQVRDPVPDANVHFFGCHLYANGDLLAVFHGFPDTPYGYGLAKLSKDSKVLWTYSANVHHTVDVGEDGRIYALTHEIVRELPRDLAFLPTPCLVDFMVELSPDGKELKKIPILEAFRDSPYAPLLAVRPGLADATWDVFHTNSVEVLTAKLAPKFPMFQSGDVLISVRELDAIAMLDPDSGKVVWAARGPWRRQHSPHFLENGNLLMFDNRGHATDARVLEYHPATQAFPWTYANKNHLPFTNEAQGESQRLPNGNTLIVASNQGELREVTSDHELVWRFATQIHIPWARRFAAEQLEFLQGVEHARP